MKTFKTIIGWVIAIIIAIMIIKLIFAVLNAAITFTLNLFVIVMVGIIALPIYIIVKKKLLNKF